MRRESNSWKTNVSLGAKPVAYSPKRKVRRLAVEAAKVTGCEIAGVDILETTNGPLLIEINSQPGWKGLQSVTNKNIANEIVEYFIKKASCSIKKRLSG
jgi:glutathione synthase/RimK-type ligase-like ATP-grasp enzyme